MDDVTMASLAEGSAAVIFDFFGTLTPGIPADIWLEHASQLAAVMGVDVPSVHEAMYESFPEGATGALGDLPQTIQVSQLEAVSVPAVRLRNATGISSDGPGT